MRILGIVQILPKAQSQLKGTDLYSAMLCSSWLAWEDVDALLNSGILRTVAKPSGIATHYLAVSQPSQRFTVPGDSKGLGALPRASPRSQDKKGFLGVGEFVYLPLAQERKSLRDCPSFVLGEWCSSPIDTAGQGSDTPKKGWSSLWSLPQPLFRNLAKKAKSWQWKKIEVWLSGYILERKVN